MSLLDERYDPKSAISRSRREKEQEYVAALGREPATRDELNAVRNELADVKRWQSTAMGKNGITINGNIFTARDIPDPAVQNFTTVVLVIAPTDVISGLPATTETSTAVPWPDATACTVDIGDQDVDIGWLGYRVEGGNLYLRWIGFNGSGGQLNGSDVTITAFLPN